MIQTFVMCISIYHGVAYNSKHHLTEETRRKIHTVIRNNGMFTTLVSTFAGLLGSWRTSLYYPNDI